MQRFLHVPENKTGRDLAVGDIHGHFTRLRAALDTAQFNPLTDRLFSVGDLVDRGPECELALDWLAQPWFFAVQGNHEDYAVRHVRTGTVDVANWSQYGGGWFLALPRERQRVFADTFAMMPLAIEVPTPSGLVGIVHADCPSADWSELPAALAAKRNRTYCQWSRRRIAESISTPVQGLAALVVGHTPTAQRLTLGNVHYIDTGGWQEQGAFTLLDLHTMEVLTPTGPVVTAPHGDRVP
jgi:serine/threonine protein phosphatase 1